MLPYLPLGNIPICLPIPLPVNRPLIEEVSTDAVNFPDIDALKIVELASFIPDKEEPLANEPAMLWAVSIVEKVRETRCEVADSIIAVYYNKFTRTEDAHN